MKKYRLKIINIYKVIILLIPLAIIFELFYKPNIDQVKTTGEFPSFHILGFTLLSSEIFVFTVAGLGIFHVMMKKIKYSSRIYFSPKIYSPLPELIFFLILASCLIGVSNQSFLQSVRTILLPALFYFIYFNMDIPSNWEKIVFDIIVIGLFGLSMFYLKDYYKAPFASGINKISSLEIQKFRYLNLMSTLVFYVSAVHLLFSKRSFRWLFIFLLSFYNFFLFIDLKSSIVPLIISSMVMLYIKIVNSRFGLLKSLTAFCVSILFIYILFMLMPEPFKNSMAHRIGTRYFKIEVTNVEDFTNNLSVYKPSVATFSDRPYIWKAYINESLKGWGFAHDGFGSTGRTGLQIEEWGRPESDHNILMFFAVNSGLIAAMLMLLLILVYVYLNVKILSKLKAGIYGHFSREDLIALFLFTFSILIASMWEGSIHNLHVAWLFWYCVALLLKRWDVLSAIVASTSRKKRLIKQPNLVAQNR